jgi:chromosome segregation protein
MDSGAHYYRTDLQIHSPRDPRWSGERPKAPEQRSEWAVKFVAACRAKRLQAVAMTDHHDFVMAPYVRDAAARETDHAGEPLPDHQRLIVFPGLELTLAALCQALLVLDASRIGAVMNRVSSSRRMPMLLNCFWP